MRQRDQSIRQSRSQLSPGLEWTLDKRSVTFVLDELRPLQIVRFPVLVWSKFMFSVAVGAHRRRDGDDRRSLHLLLPSHADDAQQTNFLPLQGISSSSEERDVTGRPAGERKV